MSWFRQFEFLTYPKVHSNMSSEKRGVQGFRLGDEQLLSSVGILINPYGNSNPPTSTMGWDIRLLFSVVLYHGQCQVVASWI